MNYLSDAIRELTNFIDYALRASSHDLTDTKLLIDNTDISYLLTESYMVRGCIKFLQFDLDGASLDLKDAMDMADKGGYKDLYKKSDEVRRDVQNLIYRRNYYYY